MTARAVIVEPSRTVRADLEDLARSVGLQPEGFPDASAAWAAATAPDAGVLLLDASCARSLGAERLSRLCEGARRRDAPVLLLGAADERGELDLPDAVWVEKPYDPEELAARLSSLIRPEVAVERQPSVLAVDDSATFRAAIGDALAADGYRVTAAASGEEALEAVVRGDFDCILMDLTMPGMSGQEACRRIKAMPERADVPIVVLTAAESRDAMVGALGAGADDFVSKSEDLDVVRARVRSHVRRKRLQDEHQRVREQLLRADERRRAAEGRLRLSRELEEKERLLDAVVHQMPSGLLVIDVAGRLAVVNARAEALWGRALLGDGSGAELSHADGRIYTRDELPLSRAAGGEGISAEEIHLRTPGGAELVLAVTAAPILGPDGRRMGAVAILDDVTAQRRSQEFQQQVLGLAGHDLRTPLTAILSTSQLLERTAPTAQVARGAIRITTSARRAARLVRDLLDFTQAHVGGGIPLHPREVDLHHLAERSLEEMGEVGERVRHLRVGDAMGIWDPDRLAQVLFNLLQNAVAHGAPEGPIVMETRGEGGRVALAVHNLGPPIPQQQLAVLFEPFRRGDAPTASREGYGLGLYIVDQIVRAHRGEVSVRSSPEEGTTFTVYLPRTPDEGRRAVLAHASAR